jgi:hypothetical protein
MKYVIEGGALPVVRIFLEPGEVMISESGGRTWAKGDILTEASSEGGAKKALGRMFSGESLFMSKYTAQSAAEIAFASSFPGKILAVELGEGRSIVAQRKAFMCATYGVTLSTFFQKKIGAGFAGGEGFIMQKITGPKHRHMGNRACNILNQHLPVKRKRAVKRIRPFVQFRFRSSLPKFHFYSLCLSCIFARIMVGSVYSLI